MKAVLVFHGVLFVLVFLLWGDLYDFMWVYGQCLCKFESIFFCLHRLLSRIPLPVVFSFSSYILLYFYFFLTTVMMVSYQLNIVVMFP